ncbi:MAG: hypothetical protein WAM14_00830 [Candidatus Nitrosopolaris sp.]
MTNKQVTIDEKQVTLDDWVIERFREKLKKAIIANRLGKPLVLYRKTLEESECSSEEELATIVSEKYVLVQVYTQGGFIPLSFQQQYVFSLDEFPKWMMKRSRELVLQCLEAMDDDCQ